MATIGRASAIADFGRVRLSGLLAWLAWLFVHILNLIGFRNRLVVFVQWAWAYFTYQRSIRLITGDDRGDSRPPRTRRARVASMLAVRRRWRRPSRRCPPRGSSACTPADCIHAFNPIVTPVSALTSMALLDGAVAILLTTALVSSSAGHASTVRVRRSSGAGRGHRDRSDRVSLVSAVLGLNYRRIPLEQKLVYDPSRITRDQGLQLARTAVERVNGLVEGAKAAPPDDVTLMKALNRVRASLRETPLGSNRGRSDRCSRSTSAAPPSTG